MRKNIEHLVICRVTIGTWNVAGRLPCENIEIDDWLCTEEPADIYIIGWVFPNFLFFHNDLILIIYMCMYPMDFLHQEIFYSSLFLSAPSILHIPCLFVCLHVIASVWSCLTGCNVYRILGVIIKYLRKSLMEDFPHTSSDLNYITNKIDFISYWIILV